MTLASEGTGPRNRVGVATVVRVALGIINGDENAGVAGGVRAREADEIRAGVGARARDPDPVFVTMISIRH